MLAARLVEENANVFVTLILAPTLLDKAETEIAAEFQFVNASEETRKRVRYIISLTLIISVHFQEFLLTSVTSEFSLLSSQTRLISSAC